MSFNIENKIILIVDDEEEIRNLLNRLFLKEGFITITATDAMDALLKLQDHDVDLVITDIRMPGMDGLELISQIHEIKPQMPAVVISGYGTLSTVLEAVEKGAFYFVNKPFTHRAILDAAMKGLRLPQPFHEAALSPPDAKLTINFAFKPDLDLISKANHMISAVTNMMGYPSSQCNIAIPFVADELMMISFRRSSETFVDAISASVEVGSDKTILKFQSDKKVYDRRLLPMTENDFDIASPDNVGLMMARRYSNSLEFSPDGGSATAVVFRKNS